MSDSPLKIYFIVGEESGDILGASLLDTFKSLNTDVKPMGLCGSRMAKHGVQSLFNISELSVMGISAVVGRLPLLVKRIRQTAQDIIEQQPDVLLMIDSPDFSYRVAKKVRKRAPEIKIIKYVAPSVWAWRQGRAKAISSYVDHILAILPFEPELLKELGGPPTTYVGHPLAADMLDVSVKNSSKIGVKPTLLALPGSRRNETKRLLPVIAQTLEILKSRGNDFEVIVPTTKRMEAEVSQEVKQWPYSPTLVVGDEARKTAFAKADVAIAASGTVTLELALHNVPLVSIYKLDPIMMQMTRFISAWTASLPNLIADYQVVPELFNELAIPGMIARVTEKLSQEGPERDAQLAGFDLVRERLKQENPSSKIAARKILEVVSS